MKTKIIILFILLIPFQYISAQEQYILNEGEISGYQIIYQKKINFDTLFTYVTQIWENIDNGDQIIIRYFEHKNEEVAIDGLPYSVGYSVYPRHFGSNAGEIIGNASYAEEYSLTSSKWLFYQKWNVVISLHYGGSLNSTEMLSLGYKIIDRIDENIPPEYLVKDQELKMAQITELEYNQLTEKGIEILSANNYSEYKTEDTKWGLASDSIVMGMRKQWSTEKSFFAIDIVGLSNAEDAEKAGINRDSMTWSPFCWLSNRESVEQAVTKSVERDNDSKRFVSVTGVIDNYAIHFYYQHQDSVDVDLFKDVILSFADDGTGITNIKQNDIQIYPNPANETLTIETQNLETTFVKLFDSTGRLINTLPIESGTNTYNISELESGVYFIQIPQKGDLVVKKFLKN